MKIMVTGSTGFIGSHLTERLFTLHHDIAVLVRQSSRIHNKAFSVYEGCDSYELVYKAISHFKPDIILHLAALYTNKHKPEDLSNLINSNISFGTFVLESMKNNNIENIINLGTRWQHLNDSDYFPANLYAATKEAFQDILVYYASQGIRYKTLELCDTFGHGDTRKKIIDLMFESCLSKRKLDLSPGDQIIDILNINDVCEYIANNVSNFDFFDNQRVGIGGNELSLRKIGHLIEKITGTSGYLNFGGKDYRSNEVMMPPKEKNMIYIAKKNIEDDLRSFAEKYN